ncbi:hypothetical protein DZC30_22235 [Comamonas testosteroni]|uniref:Tryptophan synthase subunit beta like protein n=1 Tax=Comamonas testosteroni TaxID=285 RepID=A0A373F6S3_COMTE|nr:hypothetical protein [Comamonas testosteroni]RGE39185.1 hypothetical protein DZC30_22235 [Comamonas testosteroni]
MNEMDKSDLPPLSQSSRHELSALDADFIRVLEDLIDALLANGTLRLTDLPPQALEKLSQRKQARQRLRNSLDLIDDGEELL